MLKSSITENVWKCDKCGTESNSLINPNYAISINTPFTIDGLTCYIDLCIACIPIITVPIVEDFVVIAEENRIL